MIDHGAVWTWVGTPDALLEPRRTAAPDLPPRGNFALLAGDLDDDGRAELIRGRSTVELFTQAQDGEFVPLATLELPSPTADLEGEPHLHLLDLDGSGYPSLVFASADRLVVLPQVGLLHGEQRVDIQLPHFADGLFAEDLEGDGLVELLLIGHDDQTNHYLQIVRLDP